MDLTKEEHYQRLSQKCDLEIADLVFIEQSFAAQGQLADKAFGDYQDFFELSKMSVFDCAKDNENFYVSLVFEHSDFSVTINKVTGSWSNEIQGTIEEP